MNNVTASPLSWPRGYPRTEAHKRERSNFKHYGVAVQRLQAALERTTQRMAEPLTNKIVTMIEEKRLLQSELTAPAGTPSAEPVDSPFNPHPNTFP